MKTTFVYFFSVLILIGCRQGDDKNLSDFVEVEKIDKVKIINDSGVFMLTQEQIETFKKDISSLRHAPKAKIKDSSLRFRITLEGKKYDVFSDPDAEIFSFDKKLLTKDTTGLKSGVFETSILGLKEYKPKHKIKLYAISGLGVDSRVFEELELECELIPLEWIVPKENESIQSYSMRLAESIDQSEDYGILGVSFGGLVATEISKKLNPKLTVLISTAETKEDLTNLFKLIGKYDLNDYLSTDMYDPPKRLSYFMFGTDNKKELDAILDDTDLSFTQWAVDELVNWENKTKLEKVIHICGTEDRIFPPAQSENLHLVEGGGHFMIVDKAREVSRIINDFIDSNTK